MDYSYIIIPLIVVISSQILKLVTDGVKGNLTPKDMLISYGGMPSSHTAFSVSITTLLGLRLGIDSPVFAVAFVFMILVVRDAVSFRTILSSYGQIFNKLRNQLPAEDQKNLPPLRERMGHSIYEVFGGAVLGILLTILLNPFSFWI